MTRSGAAALLAAVAALTAPAIVAAQAGQPRASLADIEDEVMCPVCGTTLELAEAAPQAQRQQALIRRLIDRGLTKEEIKDELVAEYGDEVLATPSGSGFDLSAWVLPVIGFAAAGAALLAGLVRERRRSGSERKDGEAVTPADSARVDEDIASYDL